MLVSASQQPMLFTDPQRGFTLIEVMIALSILAILMTIAVPSFRNYSANQLLRTASFDFTSDLIVARSEALKRNRAVIMQPRELKNWNAGWTLQVPSLEEPSRTIHSRGILPTQLSIGPAPESITFNSNGRVAGISGVIRIGVAAAGSTYRRCIALDPSGRPRTVGQACP